MTCFRVFLFCFGLLIFIVFVVIYIGIIVYVIIVMLCSFCRVVFEFLNLIVSLNIAFGELKNADLESIFSLSSKLDL